MAVSTWHNITTGMREATHRSYMRKSSHQRNRREVAEAWCDFQNFCQTAEDDLREGRYHVGKYRHFKLQDRKKKRDISVLPFRDRCVQNDVKEAIEPLILRFMTDDMMGGLPGRGVVASDPRHCVVEQMRQAMNDRSLKYYLQGDISKFYDNVDKVISIQLIERKIKDKRTLAIIREHLMNQKKLAIGDPFSHLIANMNMAVVIRKAKEKYGKRIRLINFRMISLPSPRTKRRWRHCGGICGYGREKCGSTISRCMCVPSQKNRLPSAATALDAAT